MRARGRDGVLLPIRASPAQPRERQQRSDLANHAWRLERRLVEAGHSRVPPARLAVRKVARDLPSLTDTEGTQRSGVTVFDQELDPLTAAAADEFFVFCAEPPPGTE
jgi:hypothetical protein